MRETAKLKFDERPYAGRQFRPRPEIHLDLDSRLLIVATPWGPRDAARKVIERMTDFLALAKKDREATSPFPRLSCLSAQANNLRIAALLANESLVRDENRQEYRAGVELFVSVLDDDELAWLQVGNPHILLSRPGRSLLPIGSQIDLAYDMSEKELMAPLPSQLLGLDSTVNFNINSFRARPGDKLVLLSHSHPPEAMFATEMKASIDGISSELSRAYPDHAFWVGILSIGAAA